MRSGRFLGAMLAAAAAFVTPACEPALTHGWVIDLVTVAGNGRHAASGWSGGPVFSPDGTRLAFTSDATDLGPPDTVSHFGPEADVFVRDLATGELTLVSHNADSSGSGDLGSSGPVFSPDGTAVLFSSAATNLGPVDTNTHADIYLRDLETDAVRLVSAAADGGSANGYSQEHAFLPDGQRIVFTSTATNLGPDDPNGAYQDVYVRDLATGETTRLSGDFIVSSPGAWRSWNPAVSPDGRRVAFESGPWGSFYVGDIFVHDLVTGSTMLVSAAAGDPTRPGNRESSRPVFSADGRYVAFTSRANDLGPLDTNDASDVYVADLTTGGVVLASVVADGTAAASGESVGASFSPAGPVVTFSTRAGDLGPIDTNGTWDIYARDLATGTTTLVSATPAGAAGNGESFCAAPFSPDGGRVLFGSTSTDLDPLDTTPAGDLYVHDLQTRVTSLVTVNADRTNGGLAHSGGCEAGGKVWSPDGTTVAFESQSGGLDPLDQWGGQDVFVARERDFPRTDLTVRAIAPPAEAQPGQNLIYRFSIGNDGPERARNISIVYVAPPIGFGFTRASIDTGSCEPVTNTPEGRRYATCRVTGLDPGQVAEVRVNVTVRADASGALTSVLAARTVPALDVGPGAEVTVVTTEVG